MSYTQSCKISGVILTGCQALGTEATNGLHRRVYNAQFIQPLLFFHYFNLPTPGHGQLWTRHKWRTTSNPTMWPQAANNITVWWSAVQERLKMVLVSELHKTIPWVYNLQALSEWTRDEFLADEELPKLPVDLHLHLNQLYQQPAQQNQMKSRDFTS